MAFDFTLGRRIDKPEENNWEELSLNDFRVLRPTILVLGGRGTNSNKDTCGYLKIVESLIGVFKEDVDLVGICYNDGTANSNFEERNIAKMVLNLFMPLVLNSDGKRLSVNEACKNMRKVTIFAHCYGVYIANEITERFMDEMNYKGFTYEEQLKILSNVFMIGYASWTKCLKFKSVNVISPYDTLFENGKKNWEDVLLKYKNIKMSPEDKKEMEAFYKKNLKDNGIWNLEEFYKNKERCFVLDHDGYHHQSLDLVCSKINKGNLDHYIKGVMRSPDWELHNWATVTGDYISRCLSCALCNSVANSILNGMTQKKHISLDLLNIKEQLEEVVKPLNEGKADKHTFTILDTK